MSVRVLALDAATYGGSVAVIAGGSVVAERSVAMRGEHEERLMPAVADVLRDAGLPPRRVDAVVCGEGPGSFTSLRIAAAIAKGLAVGANCPLYGVSSLTLIASAARSPLERGRYLAVLDAMRGDAYVRELVVSADGRVAEMGRIRLVPLNAVAREAEAVGGRPIGPLHAPPLLPHARGVAPLLANLLASGPVELAAWEPLYGRPAEAQARWEAAHGRPLSAG